ncbi:hypothetical protein [Desulfocurvus sp. DL9XJH121]
MPADENGHAQSMAADILKMIDAAREGGLDLSKGFRNEAMTTPRLRLGYLFQPHEALAALPMPPDVKRRLGRSNVLGMIEMNGKPYGIHLICSLPVPLAEVRDEAQVLAGVDHKALAAYSEQLRAAMTEELRQAEDESEQGPRQ